jgi:hypothetical protein
MREADAEEPARRAFLVGENHAFIILYRHLEMHFHTPQTPHDRDTARRQQDHPVPAVGARIMGGPRLVLVWGVGSKESLSHMFASAVVSR